MAFLSEILGHTITDIDGHYIGKLEDLIARELKDAIHPIVDAVVIKDKNKFIMVPYALVMALFAPRSPSNCRAVRLNKNNLLKKISFFRGVDLIKKTFNQKGRAWGV